MMAMSRVSNRVRTRKKPETYVTVFLLGVAFNVANLAVLAVAIFRLGPRRPHPAAA